MGHIEHTKLSLFILFFPQLRTLMISFPKKVHFMTCLYSLKALPSTGGLLEEEEVVVDTKCRTA